MPRRTSFLAALAACCAAVAFSAPSHAQEQRPGLALMGTVPIYWGEAAGFDELLAGEAPAHWARAVLEEDFSLTPLDYLSAESLAGHRYLLMAQPRGLSGEENVALDAWVRDGGMLLLFADPMMTGESRFHLGDRRRPQDVALLSPLLAHWGLELFFDAAQPAGSRTVDHFGDSLPVNMRGELRHAGEQGYCSIPGNGLLAHCAIGQGQALIVADAAMLDLSDPQEQSDSALRNLLAHIFGEIGDGAGMHAPAASESSKNGGIPSSHDADDGSASEGEGHNPP